jgi:hypothetical protein
MKPTYLMTRKERRAAAHAATATTAPTTEPVAAPQQEISAAQLAANRENAKSSTGPTSDAGRKKVSQNALKSALTGAQVLLPIDDAALYEATINDYKHQFQPVGPEETHLLQSIIDCRWRLARIPGLESALIDLARRDLLKQEPSLADNPEPVLEMQARLHRAKELRNLHLQENRLVRRREREMKEFRVLQATRQAAAEAKSQAQQAAAKQPPKPPNGFVFTPSQLTQFLATLTPEARETFLAQVTNAGESFEAAA